MCLCCSFLIAGTKSSAPPPPCPLPAVGEEPPTAGMECPLGRTWPMARAVALLCVDPTQSNETGTVGGWHDAWLYWSVAGGAYWPLATLCPPSPCLAYPYLPTHPSFPVASCANRARNPPIPPNPPRAVNIGARLFFVEGALAPFLIISSSRLQHADTVYN